MQHGCVAVQVGNARGGLTIAAREAVPKEQIILGEILEPLGTHLSLQGGPGGEFIYSDPGYTALIDSAVAVGGRAIGVPLNSRLENDLPAITAKVSQRSRAVFLVNPHNPTGIAGDTGQLKAFARTVSRQALVIVDEAYLEFADQFTQRTLADLVRGGGNVIVFRTFAKVFGLAGLRVNSSAAAWVNHRRLNNSRTCRRQICAPPP